MRFRHGLSGCHRGHVGLAPWINPPSDIGFTLTRLIMTVMEGDLNPAYISAFAALAGAAIGGLTSFGTAWLTQRAQLRNAHREAERAKLEALYNDFITEAARLFARLPDPPDGRHHQYDTALRPGRAYAPGIGPPSD